MNVVHDKERVKERKLLGYVEDKDVIRMQSIKELIMPIINYKKLINEANLQLNDTDMGKITRNGFKKKIETYKKYDAEQYMELERKMVTSELDIPSVQQIVKTVKAR